MTRNFSLIISVLIFFFYGNISAQPPKRELRSAWLTTVWGLDWPSTKIPVGGGEYYINQQKQQLIRILDSMKVAGMNAVFFQVRPECDAMYQSSFEPWSAHLVAYRGMNPGYDPLLFAIEESHKRGLELHAWLNPYRFESVAGKYAGQAGDYKQSNPEWVLAYPDKGSILDPGNPDVRKRIANIVNEIVTKYDVDGIVFDDYFYDYGGTSATLDKYSQSRWKPAGMDLHDWRRENVNQMVADVYQAIQKVKPWVTFGVSPFGIWTVDQQVAANNGITLPVGISGFDAYKTIYCDPVAWLRAGTVDYISPQLYWPTTSIGQDYKKLSPWWSDLANHFGRHFYASHTLANLDPSDYQPPVAQRSASMDFLRNEMQGLSMIEYFSNLSMKSIAAGYDPSEFGLQIQWNRDSDKNDAPGSVFFRSAMFFTRGFINYLRGNEYLYKALPPVKYWNSFENRTLPENIRIEGNNLAWDSAEDDVRFTVYAIPNLEINEPGNFINGKYLLGISYSKSFDLTDYQHLVNHHKFAVAVYDRHGNEFPPVIMGETAQQNQAAELIFPANGASVFPGFYFEWQEVENAELYLLEVASDVQFNNVIYRRGITGTGFAAGNIPMKEETGYYWRVYTRKNGVNDVVSNVFSFVFKSLPKPVVVSPANEETAVEIMPVVLWEPFGEGYTYRMQISTNNTFTALVFDRDKLTGTAFQLPLGAIFSYSTYYLRIQAIKADSITLWSDVVRFQTETTPPQIPVIISPTEGAQVAGPGATLTVADNPMARSITFQLSNSIVFPWDNRIQQSVDIPSYSLKMANLTDGTWYVKARANYGNSLSTDWSPVVSFSLLATSVSPIDAATLSLICPTSMANSPVRIRYSIPEPTRVKIYLSDLTGRRIQVFEQYVGMKGENTLNMVTDSLTRGFYLLTLETPYGRKTVKVVK